MSKKVNITRDLESRNRIAQTKPAVAKTKKTAEITLQDGQQKTQTGMLPETDASRLSAGSDKKSGRKTEGKL